MQDVITYGPGESRSYRATERRKLFLGVRQKDGKWFFIWGIFLFCGLWPKVGNWYAFLATTAVLAVGMIVLKQLYSHSLYWYEYMLGKNAYRSEPWFPG